MGSNTLSQVIVIFPFGRTETQFILGPGKFPTEKNDTRRKQTKNDMCLSFVIVKLFFLLGRKNRDLVAHFCSIVKQ